MLYNYGYRLYEAMVAIHIDSILVSFIMWCKL